MILLDTHVLVWMLIEPERLGHDARTAIDGAFASNQLFVSAISFWEVAMQVAKGRIVLDAPVEGWRTQLLADGLREAPVTGDIGVRAVGLAGLSGDPADRLIVATALIAGARLATADRSILAWDGDLPRLEI